MGEERKAAPNETSPARGDAAVEASVAERDGARRHVSLPQGQQHAIACILVGAPPTLAALGTTATLILEGDGQRYQSVAEEWASRGRPAHVQLQRCVLAADRDIPLIWYRFSDSRLNGPLPLERWRSLYPNLQLEGEEMCSSDSLAARLEAWQPAQEPGTQLQLMVRQGDPVQLLAGAGAWLDRIAAVQLSGAGLQELWQEAVHALLLARGFQRHSEPGRGWQRDPQAQHLQQLIRDRDALQADLAESARELEAVRSLAQDDAHRQAAELEALREQLSQTSRELEGVRTQSEAQVRQQAAELEALREQLSQSSRELEVMRAESEEKAQQQAALALKLERVNAALSHLFPYDLYRQKRPDLQTYTDAALMEHFVAHGLQEGSHLVFAEIQTAADTLKQERDRLQAELVATGAQAEQAAQQLAVLKDLVARMMVLKQP